MCVSAVKKNFECLCFVDLHNKTVTLIKNPARKICRKEERFLHVSILVVGLDMHRYQIHDAVILQYKA